MYIHSIRYAYSRQARIQFRVVQRLSMKTRTFKRQVVATAAAVAKELNAYIQKQLLLLCGLATKSNLIDSNKDLIEKILKENFLKKLGLL